MGEVRPPRVAMGGESSYDSVRAILAGWLVFSGESCDNE